MTDNGAALQAMMTRPMEPIFMPKPGEQSIVFDVPDEFLRSKFRPLKDELTAKFEDKDATVVKIDNRSMPDLTVPLSLDRKANFSLFHPAHQKIAAALIKILMDCKTADDLLAVVAFARDRLNPYLFNYCLSVVMLHREDTNSVELPNLMESFPGKFVDSGVFQQARQDTTVLPPAARKPIVLAREFTANSREPEQKCAYFREDLGINLHHWHWHLVYPTIADDVSMVAKDRRGELFYYMHQQVLARYNTERFVNNLGYVKMYNNLKTPIVEGYFPKLEMMIASRAWPSRPTNIIPRNIDRPQDEFQFDINDMDKWDKAVREAIRNKMVKGADGNDIQLDEMKGIDILGNMLEATMLTPNREVYGNIHNMGHVVFALCHDPDGRFLESFSVMGDTATAMRDPLFYRWHCYINDFFVQFKNSLPSYPVPQLEFRNVVVTGISVKSEGNPDNKFMTYWQQSEVNMSRGLDFSEPTPIFIRFTHLQHDKFKFVVKVTNNTGRNVVGYVRIFIAPRLNDKGTPMLFEEQRKLMIELDKFRTSLNKGVNEITRDEIDSSVTIPYERTFRSLDANRPKDEQAERSFNFCGCGWPQHMMIPRGTDKGMICDLFAMVSNYDQDKIDQDIAGVCSDADSYCGIQDKLYPDKRSMGYPFDRVGRTGVRKLTEFLTPNMKVQEVTVTFTDTVKVNENGVMKDISVVPAAAPKP